MTDKKCDGNCCDSFFESYDDIEDDYDIERLKDIIEICEFLIQTKEHRKQKRKTFKKIFEENEEDKKEREITNVPFHIYKYQWPPQKQYRTWSDVPWWDQVWF